jgi:hypothetical protein
LGAKDLSTMIEIVSLGFALLSAGIFAAHAYDMVQNSLQGSASRRRA